jgi:hypothetical protein
MAKKEVSVVYLSQGAYKTGGYLHESFLFEALSKQLGLNYQVRSSAARLEKRFEGLFGYLKLFLWYAKHAKANLTIVPLRGAIATALVNQSKYHYTLVVLHSEVQPYSSLLLKWYFLLFTLLKKFGQLKRCKLVVIHPYWKTIFEKKGIAGKDILIFPNYFDTAYYRQFKVHDKKKQVHLGMPDQKLDGGIFKLAQKLNQAGYYCYFSSSTKDMKLPASDYYHIAYFESKEAYLKEMACSICTIQMPAIAEGWSRVAHESILVGTPVIGCDKGGLGQLLKESRSTIVNNFEQAFQTITQGKFTIPDDTFVHAYDASKAPLGVKQIIETLYL